MPSSPPPSHYHTPIEKSIARNLKLTKLFSFTKLMKIYFFVLLLCAVVPPMRSCHPLIAYNDNHNSDIWTFEYWFWKAKAPIESKIRPQKCHRRSDWVNIERNRRRQNAQLDKSTVKNSHGQFSVRARACALWPKSCDHCLLHSFPMRVCECVCLCLYHVSVLASVLNHIHTSQHIQVQFHIDADLVAPSESMRALRICLSLLFTKNEQICKCIDFIWHAVRLIAKCCLCWTVPHAIGGICLWFLMIIFYIVIERTIHVRFYCRSIANCRSVRSIYISCHTWYIYTWDQVQGQTQHWSLKRFTCFRTQSKELYLA